MQIVTHERGKDGKTSKFNNLSVMTGEPYIYFEACKSP